MEDRLALEPSLTLSVAGVNFSLIPEKTSDGSVLFTQENGQYVLNLKAFSGQLRVLLSQEQTAGFITHDLQKSDERAPQQAYHQGTEVTVHEVTPKVSHRSSSTVKGSRSKTPVGSEKPAKRARVDESPKESPSETQRNNSLIDTFVNEGKSDVIEKRASAGVLAVEKELSIDSSQPTISLGQHDYLSQTQLSAADGYSSSDATGPGASKAPEKDHHGYTSARDRPSTIESLLNDERPSSPNRSTLEKDGYTHTKDSQEENPAELEIDDRKTTLSFCSRASAVVEEEQVDQFPGNIEAMVGIKPRGTTEAKPGPPRVSMGSPARLPENADKPSPRWGHTMTMIDGDRVLVYGGQSLDPDRYLPTTLQDVYLFDLRKKLWMKQLNGDGMPRQWHTSTFLPERQLLISFGGEAAHPKTGKIKTTDQVMVLDTEIMLWYPPAVSGDIPSGRSGHTATLLRKAQQLIVFGGVKGSKWLNTVSVLDTACWKWTTPKIQGSAPKPRSYHSAVAVGDRVVIFGGNDAKNSFNTVHLLDTSLTEERKWRWVHPRVLGTPPVPRTGHSAVLLADQKTICIYGGWDLNADDEGTNNDDEKLIYQDCFLLDTEKWVWSKGPNSEPANSVDLSGHDVAKRVGHESVLTDNGMVLIFGGRVPNGFSCGFLEVYPKIK